MDKKTILNFKDLPYSNENFSKFFNKTYGLAGELISIFDSVARHRFDSDYTNFKIFVGEDTVQAVSIDGGINFFTKLDENGVAQFCYCTMHDTCSLYNPKTFNFSVQQGSGDSVLVSYSSYAYVNQTEYSECGLEVISDNRHSFIENSVVKNDNKDSYVAKSEIGIYDGNTSYSEITKVEGEQALKITADKKDLLAFANELSNLAEAKSAIDGYEISSRQQVDFLNHLNGVSSAIEDVCAQSFEQ